jgi:UDP-N-acetylmuramate dehydrogenase
MSKSDSVLPMLENASLAPFTTLGVGGPARFLVRATREEQIPSALDFARARCCPVFILGGGSNIVVSDSGFPGLVLRIELRGIQPLGGGKGETISVAAGEEWDIFVRYCVTRNLAGIECLSGIPGTVGGAPVQNIGAYGEDVGEVILSIRALDRNARSITELSNADCKFAYRSSLFNTTHAGRYVILRIVFALRPNGRPRLQYPDLQRCFPDNKVIPGLSEVRETVLQIRESKAMVLRKNDPDSRSVGSFFRNPILNPNAAAKVENEARARGFLDASERLPLLPAPSGQVKFSAGWFIERAGFKKGYTRGNAGLSSKHALALVNRGGATAQDILDLMREIRTRVHEQFQIELQPEPIFVGFSDIGIYGPGNASC